MIDTMKQMLGMTQAQDSQPTQATDAMPNNGASRAWRNEDLGYGDSNDTIRNTVINTSRYFSHKELEGLYVNVWSAAKVVDLIVDDVFSPGIIWEDEEDESTKRMMEMMKKFNIMKAIPGAIKAGRLYGSSLVILAPKSQDFMEPLNPDDIREGDITHILVVPKDQLDIWQVYGDPRLPYYGSPYTYRWTITQDGKMPLSGEGMGQQISELYVHASRCIRFDGIKPTTDAGWIYTNQHEDRRWGISILSRVYDDIIEDLIMNAGGTELVKRASVPVLKMDNFRDTLARGEKGDNISPETYARHISAGINSAKVLFMDKEDDVDKLETRATGVNDLIEGQTNRLAMIAGVPISRFKGESATGLSATGNGDARDWRISVEGYRKDAIDDQWEFLMDVMARNAGLSEVPAWEWGMLGEMNAAEQATISKTLSETVKALYEIGVVNEDEARTIMNTSEIINLEEAWEPPAMTPREDDLMAEMQS